ncbi:hypothetical protein Poly51_49160 [Rubripirellula tenax]|uniref:Uncharacterized protein n=1 Tax=Rubripirellula tenax TaxID=2528015 RepID=A0A5C6EIW9_9BACT|nr:hypothetical protein Poly51_49160 [Rubripirellula tenax]
MTVNPYETPRATEKMNSRSIAAHGWIVPGATAGWALGSLAQTGFESTVMKVASQPSFPLLFGLVCLLLTACWRLPRRLFAGPIAPSRAASFAGGFATVAIAYFSLMQLHELGFYANGPSTLITSSIYYSLLSLCVVGGVELEAWISRRSISW